MCICSWWYPTSHPTINFILAFNRDEKMDRNTLLAQEWKLEGGEASFISGLDGENSIQKENINGINCYKQAGTWLAVGSNGRIAFLTNIPNPRQVENTSKKYHSRGELVTNYLSGNSGIDEYISKVVDELENYKGFNLVLGDFNKKEMKLLAHPFEESNDNQYSKVTSLKLEQVYTLSNVQFGEKLTKIDLLQDKIQSVIREDMDLNTIAKEVLKIMG
ncbi:hypothetical protein K502DRAFT_323650 [Neoconidiobolus thromboides FSU 785]|nr:hypothetical protein K502DRAFT_323650 [Neoconidiobolus thromboides FSU 785]